MLGLNHVFLWWARSSMSTKSWSDWAWGYDVCWKPRKGDEKTSVSPNFRFNSHSASKVWPGWTKTFRKWHECVDTSSRFWSKCPIQTLSQLWNFWNSPEKLPWSSSIVAKGLCRALWRHTTQVGPIGPVSNHLCYGIVKYWYVFLNCYMFINFVNIWVSMW